MLIESQTKFKKWCNYYFLVLFHRSTSWHSSADWLG